MTVPRGYEELPLYPISINAWEAGIVMGAVIKSKTEEMIPRFWKQLIELKKSVEATDGVIKEFLSDGYVRLTDCDGTIITRPRFPWEREE